VRSGSLGFAAMPAPSGTLIAFATAAGATASDGDGENGLYTEKLTHQMRLPQRIEDVFINTRNDVRFASGGKQNPQEWSQLTGQFMFADPIKAYADTPEVGDIKELINYGSIRLTTEISGELFLDGVKISNVSSNTVVPIDKVTTGKHKLEIIGSVEWEKRITVQKDQVTKVNAEYIAPTVDLILKKAEKLERKGKIKTAIGIPLVIIGGISTIGGLIEIETGSNPQLGSVFLFGGLFGGGLLGGVLWSTGAKNRERASELFKEAHSTSLYLGATKNGIGLVYTF
jgi:hypothetical protein